MLSYVVLVKDVQYILYDVLKVFESKISGYDELDVDFINVIFEEVGKLISEVFVFLNVVGDKEGCCLENGVVYMFKGFKDVFEMVKEGGWIGLDMFEEFGGQNMFVVIGSVVGEFFLGVN